MSGTGCEDEVLQTPGKQREVVGVKTITTHEGTGGYNRNVSLRTMSRYSSSCVALYIDLS